jgi:hypothetical protein
MKTENVTLRRYALPSINGEGWAIVVIGSDGYFSAVSDWGNYAYIWGAHGCADFREFLLGREGSDYIVSKLNPKKEYDGYATERAIKDDILTVRRAAGRRSKHAKENARREWEHLEQCDVTDSEVGFASWLEGTSLDEAWGLAEYRHDAQVVAFVKHVMGRLGTMIKAELDAERAVVENAPVTDNGVCKTCSQRMALKGPGP